MPVRGTLLEMPRQQLGAQVRGGEKGSLIVKSE